jgi:hypothetical protein
MKKKVFIVGVLMASLVSCGSGEETTENTENAVTTKEVVETEVEETEEVEIGQIDPFKDFPEVATTGTVGDHILTPSKVWQEDATAEGAENKTFIFYNAKMSKPGADYSTVDFPFDGEVEIPNYMIVPIKANQSAKKGDVVLTWWQSGSGMKRAIVVDDSNPLEPIVNYIDIKWSNPAKDSDGVGYGQKKEQIKPNTFHVLSSLWEAGTTVAVKNGTDYKAATIISVTGDKVLTIGFGGKMAMYNKADCTPVTVAPNVKEGDAVQAPWVGTFVNTKVVKVDKLMGRVWCEDPYSEDPMVIPFGDVTTGLPIK